MSGAYGLEPGVAGIANNIRAAKYLVAKQFGMAIGIGKVGRDTK